MKKTVVKNTVDINLGCEDISIIRDLPGLSERTLEEKYGLRSEVEVTSTPSTEMVNSFNQICEANIVLKRKIEEKNRKIDSLCVLIEALEPVPGVDPNKFKSLVDGEMDGVDFRDSKIVALAKKAHKLTMLLNKERAEKDELNNCKRSLQEDCDRYSRQIAEIASSTRSDTKGYGRHCKMQDEQNLVDGESIAKLTAELKDVKKQNDELKRKSSLLMEDNKSLSRALARELGDGVTMEQAVDGGWRGRAQQIIMLKSKVKRLEQSVGAGRAAEDVDTKAQEEIAGMGSARRRIVDALTEERVSLQEANSTLEKRNLAHKARIQILEAEGRKLKEGLQVVLDKSSNDDELLEVLRAEVARLKGLLAKNAQQAAQTLPNSNHPAYVSAETADAERQYQSELRRLQRLCDNQAHQIESQGETIRQLKRQL